MEWVTSTSGSSSYQRVPATHSLLGTTRNAHFVLRCLPVSSCTLSFFEVVISQTSLTTSLLDTKSILLLCLCYTCRYCYRCAQVIVSDGRGGTLHCGFNKVHTQTHTHTHTYTHTVYIDCPIIIVLLQISRASIERSHYGKSTRHNNMLYTIHKL